MWQRWPGQECRGEDTSGRLICGTATPDASAPRPPDPRPGPPLPRKPGAVVLYSQLESHSGKTQRRPSLASLLLRTLHHPVAAWPLSPSPALHVPLSPIPLDPSSLRAGAQWCSNAAFPSPACSSEQVLSEGLLKEEGMRTSSHLPSYPPMHECPDEARPSHVREWPGQIHSPGDTLVLRVNRTGLRPGRSNCLSIDELSGGLNMVPCLDNADSAGKLR